MTTRIISSESIGKDPDHAALLDRCIAFMNDVELLSKQWNCWIAAQQRGSTLYWPTIGEAHGDEAGYRVQSLDGTCLIDRMLPSQVSRGPNHLPASVNAFIQALTSCSREHKLWIRAAGKTQWPRLMYLDSSEIAVDPHYLLKHLPGAAHYATTLR